MSLEIRPYAPGDDAALMGVCLQTGAAGEDATGKDELRQRLQAAGGDGARAIGDAASTLEEAANRRVGLVALELLEGAEVRIRIPEADDVGQGGDAGVAPSRLSRQPWAQWFIIRPLTVRVPVMSRPEAELPGAPETPVARQTVRARYGTRSGPCGTCPGRAGGSRQYGWG